LCFWCDFLVHLVEFAFYLPVVDLPIVVVVQVTDELLDFFIRQGLLLSH
jgi:hypothetical protein